MFSRRVPRPVLLGATVLVVVAVAVVVLRGDDESGAGGLPSAEEVRALPVVALDGGAESTLGEQLDGRPTVLNFFARWCQPCREEMPAFEQVHQELGDQVQFLGIAGPEKPEKSWDIVQETGVTYPTFSNTTGETVAAFDVVALPVTVFIDGDGTVLASQLREFDADSLRGEIAEQLGVGG